jgi:hypothetical protein
LQVEEEIVLDLVKRGEIAAIVISPEIIRFSPDQVRRFLWARRQPFPGTAWTSYQLDLQRERVEREARRDARRKRDEGRKAALPPDDDPEFLTRRDVTEDP